MDSDSEEEQYKSLDQEAAQYRVSYPRGRTTREVDYDRKDEFNKKRCPVGRSGNNPGRVKRVVSCKRKTHHLTVARKKQVVSGKTYDTANKENERNSVQDVQPEIFEMDPWEFPPNVNNNHRTGRTGSSQTDGSALAELARDHGSMTDVLFGRNLRLKVALTLWKRNVGEVLTYFLRIQDTGVFVDFLPLITRCIDEDSRGVTIGCCVDLFPLVKKVLTSPYEEYLIVGFKWINAVLKNWSEQLRASGFSGSTNQLLDKNFQIFNKQLLELWHQEPFFKSLPGVTGDMAKVIDSFLSQLSW
ncbi:KATNB1-like protein 1 [Genypterus blacodes]|uniref:KATNB1-like protein 1 n=1 Tax=Genypterus blacodes TaxID=154954 RepID=UPI003F7765CC